jgi:uncharacterized protein (UPF0276 family)
MEEAEFVSEALESTDSLLLLDISNAYANAHNRRLDAIAQLASFPLHRLAYVHMGGGREEDGLIHDTHFDPVLPGALELLRQFCAVKNPPGVMLERDDNFSSAEDVNRELDQIREAINHAA